MSTKNKKASNNNAGPFCGLLSDTPAASPGKHPRPSVADDGQDFSIPNATQTNVPSTVTVDRAFTPTPRPTSLTLPFQNRQRESHLVTDEEFEKIMRRNGRAMASMPSHRSGLRLSMNLGRSSSGGAFRFGGEGTRLRSVERQRPASMSLANTLSMSLEKPGQRFNIDTGKSLPAGNMPSRDPTLTALPRPPTKCDLAVYPESDASDVDFFRRNSRDKIDIYAAMADDAYYESVTSQSSRNPTAPPQTPDDDANDRKGHKRKLSQTMANMMEAMKKRMKRTESSSLSHATTIAATPTPSQFLGTVGSSLMVDGQGSRAESVTPRQTIPSPITSETADARGHSDGHDYTASYQERINEMHRIMYGDRPPVDVSIDRDMSTDANMGGTSSNNTRLTSRTTTYVNDPAEANVEDDMEMDVDMDVDKNEATNKNKAQSKSNPLKSTWSAMKNLKHKQYNPFAPLFNPKEPNFDIINPRQSQHQSVNPVAPVTTTAATTTANNPSTIPTDTSNPFLSHTPTTRSAITHAQQPFLTPLPAPWQTLPRPILASEIARLENRTRELRERNEGCVREIETLRERLRMLEGKRRGMLGRDRDLERERVAEMIAERRRGWIGVGGCAAGVSCADAGEKRDDDGKDGDGETVGGEAADAVGAEDTKMSTHMHAEMEVDSEEKRKTWMTVDE